MINYTISYLKNHNRFINIECVIDFIQSDQTLIQLPVWRPGRYELGYFAKNIQSWKVFNAQGKELCFQKMDHSSWLVETKQTKIIHIQYNYYAAPLGYLYLWVGIAQW